MQNSSINSTSEARSRGFHPWLVEALAFGIVFLLGALLGITSARPRIPSDRLAPPTLAPVGTAVVVTEAGGPAALTLRDLIDHHFASDNGIHPSPPEQRGAVISLPPGSPGVVEKGDLEYLRVRFSDRPEALWVRGSTVGISLGGK